MAKLQGMGIVMRLWWVCVGVVCLMEVGYGNMRGEDRMWADVKKAHEDGLVDVLGQRLERFMKQFPRSERLSEGRALLAQVYYDQGRFLDVERLGVGVKDDGTDFRKELDYVMAESYLALERWGDAERMFRSVLSRMPGADLTQKAQLGLAWALLKQGKRADGVSLLNNLSINYAGTVTGQRARLIRVRLMIAEGKLAEAQAELRGLLQDRGAMDGSVWYEGWMWMGAIQMQEAQYAEAIVSLLKATESGKAYPRWVVAQGLIQLGRAYQAINSPQKALEAYEQAFYAAEREGQKLSSLRAWLSTAKELKVMDGVLKVLMGEERRLDGVRGMVDFTVGEFLAEHEREIEAVKLWEKVAGSAGDSRWKGMAMLKLAQRGMREKKMEKAERWVREVLSGDYGRDVLSRAYFMLGELRYAQGGFLEAKSAFNQASEDDGLAEAAKYNVLLCVARSGDVDGFLRSEKEFLARFPQSAFRDQILGEKARLFEKADRADLAMRAYEEALKGSVEPQRRVELLLRLAISYEKANRLKDAEGLYEEIIVRHRDHDLYVEAAYRQTFVKMHLQEWKGEEARERLYKLWEENVKNSLAPYILFSVGELDFNRKDFVSAQLSFERLVHDYPQSELIDQALFFAGQSAAGHNDFSSAIALLEKISDRASVKNQARLLQARLYQQQGQFQGALKIYDAILDREKDGPIFVRASLGKGDSLFALGANLGARYEQAAEVYRQVISSGLGDIAQRNEAGYKYGKSLEKLGKVDEALAMYVEVVRGRMTPEGQRDTPLSEYFWTIKAGLNAADILQEKKDWRGTLEIYRALLQLKGPHENQFREMINRLRRDHFLYEE
jgi:tetratricopeptide (TPR) repeat protein